MNPELEEIRTEIKEVKEHSETWNMLKYQSAQACKERFRQWVLILVLIILLVLSNLVWVYAWFQYDYVSESYVQDGTVNTLLGDGANSNSVDVGDINEATAEKTEQNAQ